jgi:hypothetical protein
MRRQAVSLNEQVALARGWTKCEHDYPSPHWVTPDGNTHFQNPSDYEHDIAAAWELVDWADSYQIQVSSEGNGRTVAYLRKANIGRPGFGDTAPEAICRAFLITREEKSDE